METQKSFFAKHKRLLAVLGVLLIVLFWVVSKYNSFVRVSESITSQWAQVENQYERRFDLIPNIVNTVKGVAKQEQQVFSDIAEARTRYSGARTSDDRAKAATEVEGALGRLLVIAENYPVLQSSGAYRDLITSLEGTENRISVERMKYNDLVRSLNAGIKTFPSSVVAKMFGIGEKAYFDVPEEKQVVPEVQF